MINPGLRLWLKRSSAKILAPGLVLLIVVAVWSRPGWEYDWGWALSWTAGISPVLTPLVAGIAAHDRAVRHSPTLLSFERSTRRGVLAGFTLPTAVFVWAFLAWAMALGIVSVRVGIVSGLGAADYSPVAEIAVCLAAAAFFGAAVGGAVRNRAAGPIAALTVYLVFMFGSRIGLGSIFMSGGMLDPSAGWQRNGQWLLGFIGIHLAVVAASGLILFWQGTVYTGTKIMAALGSLVVFAAGAAGFSAAKSNAPYDPVSVATVCVGHGPEVCGPRGTEELLDAAAGSLHDVYQNLGNSGLSLRDRYIWEHQSANGFTFEGAGVVEIDPGSFEDGRVAEWYVVAAITTPTRCDAYTGERIPEDLMAARKTVRTWLEGRLDGTVRDSEAPINVQAAYDELLSCASAGTVPS